MSVVAEAMKVVGSMMIGAGLLLVAAIAFGELANEKNSAQPAQEIEMTEKLARTVGPAIGAKIHPDDATVAQVSAVLMASGDYDFDGAVHDAIKLIAEAKRQRKAAEVKP